MKVIANKKASELEFGDILKTSQIQDLNEALNWEGHYSAGVAGFNTHYEVKADRIVVTDVKKSDRKSDTERFGEHLVIWYVSPHGTGQGRFYIGPDVKVLVHSN